MLEQRRNNTSTGSNGTREEWRPDVTRGGPGAVALTLGFTSLRSHPVPSLRWGCENRFNYSSEASF